MKKLLAIMFACSLLISCSDNGNDWMSYRTSFKGFGESSYQCICLKIDEDNRFFVLHWFIYDRVEEKSVMVLMTFSDSIVDRQGTFFLPTTIMFNEFKSSSGRIFRFPLDQDPVFGFDPSSEILTVFNTEIKQGEWYSDAEMDDFLLAYSSWNAEMASKWK